MTSGYMAFSFYVRTRACLCVCNWWTWGGFITFCSAFPRALIISTATPKPPPVCWQQLGFPCDIEQQIIDFVFCVSALCVSPEVVVWAFSSSVIMHRPHFSLSEEGNVKQERTGTILLRVNTREFILETLSCHFSFSVSLWFPVGMFKEADISFLHVHLSREYGIRSHWLVRSSL